MTGLFEDLPTEREMVARVVDEGGAAFRAEFKGWLLENWHIWKRFVREADKVRGTGREHYSARTIGEFLRHETALRQVDTILKVDNRAFPDMARLYMRLRPEAAGFFELRQTTGRAA